MAYYVALILENRLVIALRLAEGDLAHFATVEKSPKIWTLR
jgi:hypothetical protein